MYPDNIIYNLLFTCIECPDSAIITYTMYRTLFDVMTLPQERILQAIYMIGFGK